MPLRPLRAREVIRKLQRAGFRQVRQRGSHAATQPQGTVE
ncbi:MAG: type II toxin-antitoxin system HicA family toxin [Dehalococcoidia bacterium]|nr:type II toxin-antitoxin system HicA family toxin [Dehalococcoidia bacterium]